MWLAWDGLFAGHAWALSVLVAVCVLVVLHLLAVHRTAGPSLVGAVIAALAAAGVAAARGEPLRYVAGVVLVAGGGVAIAWATGRSRRHRLARRSALADYEAGDRGSPSVRGARRTGPAGGRAARRGRAPADRGRGVRGRRAPARRPGTDSRRVAARRLKRAARPFASWSVLPSLASTRPLPPSPISTSWLPRTRWTTGARWTRRR